MQEQSGLSTDEHTGNTRIIDTPEGQFTISFTPKPKTETVVDRETTQPFGNGYLSVEQANLILNHLPLKSLSSIKTIFSNTIMIMFLLVKWFLNEHLAKLDETLNFVIRPKCLIRSIKSFELLRSGERDQVPMWFKSERLGKFVYVTYAAVRDDKGDFQGVLEYVQDIKPFFELESDLKKILIKKLAVLRLLMTIIRERLETFALCLFMFLPSSLGLLLI